MKAATRNLSVALLLVLVGCGGSSTAPPPFVATVTVSPSQPSIEVGQTVQMSAATLDASGSALSGKSVTWSSANSSVATVSGSGLVTGVSAGTAPIRASSEGRTGSTTVTVTPLPVVTVEVTPDPADLISGFAIQMSATLRDRNGAELTGRTVAWSSGDPSIATVAANTGVVTGVAEGNTTVTATSEGVSGDATVNVTPQPPVVVNTVTPDPLVEGEPASLTGGGFSAVPAENRVTVDGLEAVVTQATSTTLDFVVPISACQPARSVQVQVTVASETSNAADSDVRPPAFLNMAVGDHLVLNDTSGLCLQFEEKVGAERYLLAVQSVSEVAGALTPVRLSSSASPAAQVRPPLPAPPLSRITHGPVVLTRSDQRRAERWAAHSRAETEFMERERAFLSTISRTATSRSATAAGSGPARIAPDVPVGTQLTLRFPGFDTNSCTDFVDIEVVVRKVSARAIFVEDITNPAGGFTTADWDGLGDDLDSTIYDSNVDFFGAPSDLDENERVVVVVTKEVNDLRTSSPLAFVSGSNLLPVESCPASNFGEFYWSRAPDPSGSFAAGEYSLEEAQLDGRSLLAHEITHIIQQSGRLMVNGSFMASFMAEGGATAAEEFAAFRFENRMAGQNYDNSAIYSSFGADEHFYYAFLGDLLAYFGFDFDGNANVGAPEECTWVGEVSASPCDFANRLRYGGTYSLVQHALDLYGAGLGGPQAVHRALVQHAGAPGFPALEAVFGMSIGELMASWVLMLYVDDRFMGPELQNFQFLNWNLRSLEDAWATEAARLAPRALGFSDNQVDLNVRGGSFGLFDLSGGGRPATAVRVLDQNGDPLPSSFQISVLRVE